MNHPQDLVETLSIQQVSERLKLSKHTLRFWEKELGGVIVPLRTKGGQRRYTLEHLLIIEDIKKLKDEGLSLLDIKRRFDNHHVLFRDSSNSQNIDLLANRIAEMVKSAVYHFLGPENFQKKPE